MTTELTAQQQRAIDLLIQGKSATDIAKELGVCRKTISRWRALPEFMEAFNDIIQELRLFQKSAEIELYASSMRVLQGVLGDQWDENRTQTAIGILRLFKPNDRMSQSHVQNVSKSPKMSHNVPPETKAGTIFSDEITAACEENVPNVPS